MGISAALGSSALLPAGLGFRNAIINGDFRINQRGFTSTTTTASYGFDRWFGQWDGGTTTYSAQTFSLGNAIPDYEPVNYARLVTTSQTSASHYARLEQRIESVRTGAGRVVTVSFWAKAGSGTPKVAVELQQYFGTGGSPSTSVNTLVAQATLSTTWVRYTMTVTLPSISGKTIGSNNNDFLGLYFYVSAGSDYSSRTGSLGVQNATFDFWGVQVEQNNVPTTFEQRPVGVELALCQRYYYTIGGDSTYQIIANGGVNYSTTQVVGTAVMFPVTMRTTPDMTYSSLGDLGVYNNSGGIVTITSLSINTNEKSPKFAGLRPVVASGLVAGDAGVLVAQSTSARVNFSAEL